MHNKSQELMGGGRDGRLMGEHLGSKSGSSFIANSPPGSIFDLDDFWQIFGRWSKVV